MLEREPENPAALSLRGELLAERGELEAAEASYRAALAANREQLPALVGLGHVRLAQGAAGEALELAREVLAVAPGHAPGFDLAGRAHEARGERAEAREAFALAAQLAPEDPEHRRSLERAGNASGPALGKGASRD